VLSGSEIAYSLLSTRRILFRQNSTIYLTQYLDTKLCWPLCALVFFVFALTSFFVFFLYLSHCLFLMLHLLRIKIFDRQIYSCITSETFDEVGKAPEAASLSTSMLICNSFANILSISSFLQPSTILLHSFTILSPGHRPAL